MTNEEYQRLSDLLSKKFAAKPPLTSQEQALLNELLAKDRNQFSAAQIETMREATRQTAKLVECGLTLAQIAFHREILRRLEMNDAGITPEEMRKFEDVRRDIERCLQGGGTPPGGASSPDGSGPDITDTLGVQPVDDDDEAKPTAVLPLKEPAPVQLSVQGKPKSKEKTKPRTSVSKKKSGVDFP